MQNRHPDGKRLLRMSLLTLADCNDTWRQKRKADRHAIFFWWISSFIYLFILFYWMTNVKSFGTGFVFYRWIPSECLVNGPWGRNNDVQLHMRTGLFFSPIFFFPHSFVKDERHFLCIPTCCCMLLIHHLFELCVYTVIRLWCWAIISKGENEIFM